MRRIDKRIAEDVVRYSNDGNIKLARCIITTCLAANSIPRRRFDFLLIDEAGQSTEPDILIPIASAPGAQIILAGDPKQLGPVVKSPYGLHFGHGFLIE